MISGRVNRHHPLQTCTTFNVNPRHLILTANQNCTFSITCLWGLVWFSTAYDAQRSSIGFPSANKEMIVKKILQVIKYFALLPWLFPFKVASDSWICVSRSVVECIGSVKLNDSYCIQSARSIF